MVSLEDNLRLLALYNKGLSLYMSRNFKEAYEYFSRCLQIDPNDGASKVYLERCQEYINNPPPPDWDGVFEMKSK